jgi:putative ABC transport system substrate-binding protein
MRCGTVRGVIILALSLLCAPRTVAAQQPGHVARVGILVAAQRGTGLRALEQRLRELGYVEGQNLRLEFRTAEGHLERFPALVADLVRLPVDVLVTFGPEATLRAAKDATSTLPTVMIAVDYDPMALGYIAGLPRPGGNITGVFFQQLELTSKRLELLKEALPQLRRVAVLWDGPSADQWRAAANAARELGVQVQSLEMHLPSDSDFTGAVRAAVQGRAEALLVLMSPILYGQRDRIAAVAAQYRLPTMFGVREFVEAGGLMAYGASLFDMGRRAADYVDKILKGAKPAQLPVEQPTKFELVLNLKTAQALGITMPPSLLILADEVIK